MTFRILGLPADNFTHLFALSDAELAAQGAVRRTVDGKYPCRVSLTDSEAGEQLLLINYEHHAVDSPYRMRFAIFLREGEIEVDGTPAETFGNSTSECFRQFVSGLSAKTGSADR